jgi:hypothetical protein
MMKYFSSAGEREWQQYRESMSVEWDKEEEKMKKKDLQNV